jgi:hypothetical protein
MLAISKVLDYARLRLIGDLASKYNFSYEEACRSVLLDIGEKKGSMKSALPLPFTGQVSEECCSGLRNNHGLLTQCQKGKCDSKEYCSGCQKQADKNASGKPNSGSIEERLAAFNAGKEYRDPKGKAPVAYAKVMQKLKLTEEMVREEAGKKNIVLPSDIFNTTIGKRGRPKKNPAVVSDTESENSNGGKKRGRPKKAGKTVEVSTTEDLFASLISEAKANSPRPQKADVKEVEPKEAEKTVEEEEVKVKKFEFKGTVYYRTSDNVLYDPKTQDCVGVFNEERQEIDECEEDDEDEDEDEDEA